MPSTEFARIHGGLSCLVNAKNWISRRFYKSAIAPKIPALSVFKSEFKLSKFPSLWWIVFKYNCNAISQGQLLEMANTIIEFLTILQVSCDYDLTIYTLVMALILQKNNKKTQKYWEVSQCKIMSKVPLLKRHEK